MMIIGVFTLAMLAICGVCAVFSRDRKDFLATAGIGLLVFAIAFSVLHFVI